MKLLMTKIRTTSNGIRLNSVYFSGTLLEYFDLKKKMYASSHYIYLIDLVTNLHRLFSVYRLLVELPVRYRCGRGIICVRMLHQSQSNTF